MPPPDDVTAGTAPVEPAPPQPIVPESGGPPDPPDPFGDAVDRVIGQQKALLVSSLTQGTKVNPDAHAKTLDLAARTGLDPSLVQRNQPAVDAAAKLRSIDTQNLLANHTDLAHWLSNGNNAAVAHDDIHSLVNLDHALSAMTGDTDSSGFLPHGFQFAKDGTIHEPIGDGSQSNVYQNLDHLSQELRLRGERDLADEIGYQANAARLDKQLGILQTPAFIGSEFLSGMKEGLGTAAAPDREAQALFTQNNPGLASNFFTGALPSFAGGLAGAAPSLIAGTGLGGVGGIADLVGTLRVLNQARALVSPVIGSRLANLAVDQVKVTAGMTPMNLAQAKQDFDTNGDVSHAAMNLLVNTAVVGGIPASGFGQKLFLGREPGAKAADIIEGPQADFVKSMADRATAREGNRGVAQGLLASIGLQATQGAVQSLGSALNDRATLGKPLDAQKILNDMAVNGGLGGLMGAAFGLGPAIGNKFHQDAVAAHAGMEFGDQLRMGVEQLKTSKLNQRSPDAMNDAMETMAPGGHVYMQAKDWQAHWLAEGEDPHAKAELAGAGQSYREAQATGGEMQIPRSRFMQGAADSSNSDRLVNAARQAPGAPSAIEGHEILSTTPEKVAEQYKTLGETIAKSTLEGSPSSDQIHEDLLHQLFAAHPQASTEKLDSYASTVANMFHVLAERSGVDPLALYKQFPLSIVGDGGILATHAQVQDTMRSMLEKVQGGEIATHQVGESLQALKGAVEAQGMSFKEHTLDQIQTNLEGQMKAQYEQKGIPVPEDLRGRGLRAEWKRAHGGKLPVPGDKLWKQLVEQSRQVDEATNNPVMRALRDYEAGPKDQVHISDNGQRYIIGKSGLGSHYSETDHAAIIDSRIPEEARLPLVALETKEAELLRAGVPFAKAHVEAVAAQNAEANRLGYNAAHIEGLIDAALKEIYKSPRFSHSVRPEQLLQSGAPAKVVAAGRHRLEQPARGSLEFGEGKFKLTLNKDADTSTVFHEMMHMWTEVMGELSQRPETPQQIKDDYQKMLEFSGYGTHEGKVAAQKEVLDILTGAQGRVLTEGEQKRITELNAPHEKLAEAHEQYLMEGKTPSEELRSVFAKIKAWMMTVYQTVKALGIQLNPEITGVFDRIHATDQAIEEASQTQGMEPIFKDAASSGWGAEKFAAYARRAADIKERDQGRAEREAIREFRKTLSNDYKEKRQAIQDEVAPEVAKRQVYAAMEALQHGKGPDGEPLPEVDANGLPWGKVKLDRAELIAVYGKDILKELPGPGHARNAGPHIYASEGGMDLARAAEAFGYHSSDEMVRDLKDAPSRADVVKAETDSRMAKLYPDALRDGTLPKLALDELHSEAKAKLEQEEVEALAARINREAVPLAMLRASAKRLIINRRQRDLNPNQYRVAEAKAGREVEKALAKGDYEEAFAAKQRKMLNGELFKAARDAYEAATKIPDYVKGTDTAAARERIGKAGGWEWIIKLPDGTEKSVGSQAEAEKISRSYGVGNAPFSRVSSYLDQMDAIKSQYEFSRIPLGQLQRRDSLREWVAKKALAGEPVAIPPSVLDSLGQTNWRDLSVQRLYDVRDALKNIEKMARLKNRLLDAQRTQSLQDTVGTMAASLAENAPRAKLPKFLPDAVVDKAASLVRVPDFIYRMDGHRDGGAMFDGWQRPINVSADRHAVMAAEDTVAVHEALDNWGKLSDLNPAHWLRNIALLHKEFIPEINAGLSKWEQLMVAFNWGNEGNRDRLMSGHGWSAEQAMAIIGRLDAKDKDLVHAMWKLASRRRSEIGALEERVHGAAPEWVEATPFQNHLGTWDGGYARIVYDNAKSINPYGVGAGDEANLLMSGRGGGYAMTSHGHVEERQGSQGRPLLLDFRAFTNALDSVSKDLAWRETLMDSNRILRDKTWSDALIKGYGKSTWDQFQNQLLGIAGGDKGLPVGFEAPLAYLRQGSNAAMRAFNVAGTFQQLAGLPFIIPRVGFANFLKGLAPAFNPASHHWVESVSPTMRFRNAERGKMLNEAINRGSILGPLRAFPDTAYMFMNKAWSVLDAHAWFANYNKALAEFPGDEEKARAIADNGMATTQGATHTKDMAQAMRGGELAKVFTNNMSWASANFNLMVSSVQRYADKGYSGPAAAKMASDMLTYLVVCPAIYLAVRQALTGQSMQDWTDPTKTAKHLTGEATYTVLSSMPLFRDAASAIQEGKRSDGLQGTSGLSALINAGAEVSHAIQDTKEHREKPGLSSTERAAIRTGGILFHFPATQIIHTLDGWNYAETHGENPLLPMLMGKPPKQ